VLVGWQPIGRRYSWWPTGAAPASLTPVVDVVFICGLSDVIINEYLFLVLRRLLHAQANGIKAVYFLRNSTLIISLWTKFIGKRKVYYPRAYFRSSTMFGSSGIARRRSLSFFTYFFLQILLQLKIFFPKI